MPLPPRRRRPLRRFFRRPRPIIVVNEFNRLERLRAQNALTASELARYKQMLADQEMEHQQELAMIRAEDAQEDAAQEQNIKDAAGRQMLIVGIIGGVILLLMLAFLILSRK